MARSSESFSRKKTADNPGPVWYTTQGTDPAVVSQLQNYSYTLTNPALRGTTVRIGIEVFSGDNFLHVALDDFHINPTRSTTSNPQPGLIHSVGDPFPSGPNLLLPPPMSMSMAADSSSLDLEMLTLKSLSTSGPTIISVLDSLSAAGSSSLVSALEQQSGSATPVVTQSQVPAQSDLTKVADVGLIGTTNAGSVPTTTQTVVVLNTPEEPISGQTVAPVAQEVTPEGVVPTTDQIQPPAPTDQSPPAPVDVQVTLAGGFDPELNLNSSMVFDRDYVSPMQILELSTEMHGWQPATQELRPFAMRLAEGQSGSISLDALSLTEIFA